MSSPNVIIIFSEEDSRLYIKSRPEHPDTSNDVALDIDLHSNTRDWCEFANAVETSRDYELFLDDVVIVPVYKPRPFKAVARLG